MLARIPLQMPLELLCRLVFILDHRYVSHAPSSALFYFIIADNSRLVKVLFRVAPTAVGVRVTGAKRNGVP